MNKNQRARSYIAFLFDRSGSMHQIAKEAVDGFNEQVEAVMTDAENDALDTYVSLITFNGKVTEDFFNAPVDILRKLDYSQYNPSGGTAWYDALGYTITRYGEETDLDDEYNSYLVVSVTDGQERDSRIWKDPRKLAQRITELEATNRWTFTVCGANVDLKKIGDTISMRSGNTLAFANTREGTQNMFHSNAGQMKRYLKLKSASPKNFAMADFYEGAKTAEELLAKQRKAT